MRLTAGVAAGMTLGVCLAAYMSGKAVESHAWASLAAFVVLLFLVTTYPRRRS